MTSDKAPELSENTLQDPIVQSLMRQGKPVTKENYLLETAPDRNWNDPDVQESLPPEFRWED
jgi:hypothetical protein